MKILAVLLCALSLSAGAQEKPKEVKPEGVKVSEMAKLRLLDAYKTAMIIQEQLNLAKDNLCGSMPQCASLKASLDKAVEGYRKVEQDTLKELPAGSAISLTVDPDGTGRPVDVSVTPKAKDEPKAEAKPEAKK